MLCISVIYAPAGTPLHFLLFPFPCPLWVPYPNAIRVSPSYIYHLIRYYTSCKLIEWGSWIDQELQYYLDMQGKKQRKKRELWMRRILTYNRILVIWRQMFCSASELGKFVQRGSTKSTSHQVSELKQQWRSHRWYRVDQSQPEVRSTRVIQSHLEAPRVIKSRSNMWEHPRILLSYIIPHHIYIYRSYNTKSLNSYNGHHHLTLTIKNFRIFGGFLFFISRIMNFWKCKDRYLRWHYP